MRVLIAGCGYVGLPLGAELIRQGHEVFGLRRSVEGHAELKAAGIQALVADITKPEDLALVPTSFDWVVNTVSSTKGGAAEYRQVYLEGMRNLIQWLAPTPPKKFVYTSSTSVYGHTDGTTVKETSLTEPASETSRILVAAEKVLMDASPDFRFPAVILRVAGIYGPGRGHLFQQYLRNQARIAGQGERNINMVHLDDVVGIIIAALRSGRAGEVYH
jgi:nucleoside-diphosphate-sugar epimerase